MTSVRPNAALSECAALSCAEFLHTALPVRTENGCAGEDQHAGRDTAAPTRHPYALCRTRLNFASDRPVVNLFQCSYRSRTFDQRAS